MFTEQQRANDNKKYSQRKGIKRENILRKTELIVMVDELRQYAINLEKIKLLGGME